MQKYAVTVTKYFFHLFDFFNGCYITLSAMSDHVGLCWMMLAYNNVSYQNDN